MDDLVRRVAVLEKRLARWRLAFVALGFLLAAAAWRQREELGVVDCRELNIVDANGQARATFGVTDQTVKLSLYGEKVGGSFVALTASNAGVGLNMIGDKKAAALLGVQKGEPVGMLKTDGGKLYLNPQGMMVSVPDKKHGVLVGVDDNGPLMTATGADGKVKWKAPNR